MEQPLLQFLVQLQLLPQQQLLQLLLQLLVQLLLQAGY